MLRYVIYSQLKNDEWHQISELWQSHLDEKRIPSWKADFPMAARRRILSLFRPFTSGSTLPSGSGVIAGFFYRDLDGDGGLSIGETLPATLVGAPAMADKDADVNCYFNCYWTGPISVGTTCRLLFEADVSLLFLKQ